MTFPWSAIPAEEQARLKRNEAAQRRETAKRELPALPQAVGALWQLQLGMCPCNECKGSAPLDPATAVIAHKDYRAGKGSPGHVFPNVQLWNPGCNKREAALETSAMWKGRRFAADITREKPKKPKGSFGKPPKGYVSPLSKEGRAKMKRKMR